MPKPRHKSRLARGDFNKKKEPRALQAGDLLTVTRLMPTGEVVSYQAYLQFTDGGRAVLEQVRSKSVLTRTIARALFVAAKDLPIVGYRNWFMISGLPVELSRHASRIACMTGILFRQNSLAA